MQEELGQTLTELKSEKQNVETENKLLRPEAEVAALKQASEGKAETLQKENRRLRGKLAQLMKPSVQRSQKNKHHHRGPHRCLYLSQHHQSHRLKSAPPRLDQ